jgi:glucose-6-phosphate isomerase
MIRLDDSATQQWITSEHVERLRGLGEYAQKQLWDLSIQTDGKGWVNWATDDHSKLFAQVDEIAAKFRGISDVTVVIGIGGSYLGAKSALSMLRGQFLSEADKLRVVFAGHQLSARYMTELLEMLDSHEVTVVVISKSGGTLEPSAAFHTLRAYMEKRYQGKAAERICAITDADKGTMRTFAQAHGYATLPIPADIGGRYSVLTAVGLMPMAIAGIDYRKVMSGAKAMHDEYQGADVVTHPGYRYGLIRHALYLQGFSTEALVTYEPSVADFAGWWQQLFGESQGKDGTGLFPTMLQYSTDLHSMGQYIQDARRILFETVLDVKLQDKISDVTLPQKLDEKNEYIQGKTFSELQNVAIASVISAHQQAGVPNLHLTATGSPEELYGELVCFFEVSCAFGGYLLGINPFDQPGVEAYKDEMRHRLT